MTWQRQESTTACDSCRAYWNTLQDLGEEWDAAGRPQDPTGWGRVIGQALAMYAEHLAIHLPQRRTPHRRKERAAVNEYPSCTRCARDLRDDELPRFLCRICEDRAAAALIAIPTLYGQLGELLHRGASTGPAVSGSKTAPVPLRLDILELQLETGPVLAPLQAWVRDWETYGHAELCERGSLQDRVAGACRTLRYNLRWAVEHHAAVDEFADELGSIHRTLIGVTFGERPARRLHAQCPCGHTLPFTLNTRGETCRACGAEYGHSEILRLPLADRRAAA